MICGRLPAAVTTQEIAQDIDYRAEIVLSWAVKVKRIYRIGHGDASKSGGGILI
jgi:hypothetical protein